MSRQFAVIGLGRFGSSVARTLAESGAEVLAIDREIAPVEAIASDVSQAISFDATVRQLLESHGVAEMDAVVVGIGENFESMVLVTALAKELGIPLIVARAYNQVQRRILTMVGATEVVNPEEEIGKRLARNLIEQDAVDFLDLPEGFELRDVKIGERHDGHSLEQLLEICKERVVAVRLARETGGDKQTLFAIPLPDTILREGDRLSVIGPERALDRL